VITAIVVALEVPSRCGMHVCLPVESVHRCLGQSQSGSTTAVAWYQAKSSGRLFECNAPLPSNPQQLSVTIMCNINIIPHAAITQRPAPACLTFMHKAIDPIILDVLSKREVSTS